MKGSSYLAGLAAIFLLLVGCASEKTPAGGTVAVFEPTVAVATPTLLPGLPTSTPWRSAGVQRATSSPTPASPTSPPPPPTATPKPAERLDLGQTLLESENFVAAAEQYQAGLLSDELNDEQRREALLGLGQAQLAEGRHAAADEAFGLLLSEAAASTESDDQASRGQDSSPTANAYFLQARSYEAQGDCQAAIGAYKAYLESDDTLAAYVQPRIADCFLALGEPERALEALEASVAAEALPVVSVPLRFRLAQLYQESGKYEASIAQYEAILATSQREETLGQAIYLAGAAELLAGNTEEAYDRFMEGVERYPRAYESYLGLVALVDAGYEVDDFQRGVVDYHANAYDAAVTVLSRYVETTADHNEEAHLYLAWSLEALGNVPAALEQIDVYIEAHMPVQNGESAPAEGTPQATAMAQQSQDGSSTESAARGAAEKAKMLARAGEVSDAAESYAEYVTQYAEEEDGPYAAWWSAAFSEQLGESTEAIARFQLLAELYPDHEDADEALFRAGYLARSSGDLEMAQTIWQQAVTRYPDEHFGAAALVWLLKTTSDDDQEQWLERASETRGSTYYPLRAQHIANEIAPFEPSTSLDLALTEGEQRRAESWLSERLDLSAGSDLSSLPENLSGDGRLARGAALWQLGLRQEAKAELESLRREYAGDPLTSYQLALFFRDLGLYRSSIIAAASVLDELEVDVFDAPRFIAGLAYPAYYADLITAEAGRYGYDPLLQFALVRQESLFESFATSGAAAQGLSQVIPDTGAYIAQRLGWPDYVNEDLYRPYVGIAFGAFYLDQQLDAFDGDVAAALSAYNAGPGNAARWYEESGGDIDLYVDTVDFSETRQYIERIYAGHAIYRHIYGDG